MVADHKAKYLSGIEIHCSKCNLIAVAPACSKMSCFYRMWVKAKNGREENAGITVEKFFDCCG
jgi:hypothetical protein